MARYKKSRLPNYVDGMLDDVWAYVLKHFENKQPIPEQKDITTHFQVERRTVGRIFKKLEDLGLLQVYGGKITAIKVEGDFKPVIKSTPRVRKYKFTSIDHKDLYEYMYHLNERNEYQTRAQVAGAFQTYEKKIYNLLREMQSKGWLEIDVNGVIAFFKHPSSNSNNKNIKGEFLNSTQDTTSTTNNTHPISVASGVCSETSLALTWPQTSSLATSSTNSTYVQNIFETIKSHFSKHYIEILNNLKNISLISSKKEIDTVKLSIFALMQSLRLSLSENDLCLKPIEQIIFGLQGGSEHDEYIHQFYAQMLNRNLFEAYLKNESSPIDTDSCKNAHHLSQNTSALQELFKGYRMRKNLKSGDFAIAPLSQPVSKEEDAQQKFFPKGVQVR